MNYLIRKVAVLGSGVMGTGIAAHLSNCGFDVLLLDIPSKENTNKNAIVNGALKNALNAKPAPFYDNDLAKNITTGNFDDDLPKIQHYDWIIEVVVEKLEIKKQIFERVEQYRKNGTLVSSNTSGIPIHLMAEGRSDDFQKHFCGTHFFNPPRYLKLFEIIPHSKTDKGVIEFFRSFADQKLGKTPILCKDTPAFIANRVGVYAMSKIFQLAYDLKIPIDVVDKLTGPAIGRPKTGTFRLADLVGLDVAEKVMSGIQLGCPKDEQINVFNVPDYIKNLIADNALGNKTNKGFYWKKDKTLLQLNIETGAYEEKRKVSFPSLEHAKQIDNVEKSIASFFKADDDAAKLIQGSFAGLFSYVSNRIPEISDDIIGIDDALKSGFGWKYGPFEYWDIIGLEKGIYLAEKEGYSVAGWVKNMLENGCQSFYKNKAGIIHYYDLQSNDYLPKSGALEFIQLKNITTPLVTKTAETNIYDIGDGVLCVEFTSKANTIGGGVLEGIHKAIDIAEKEGWKGVVIGNNADNFSVGANLMMIAMMAYEQEFDELNYAVQAFQNTTMRCRYSAIPVVAATKGYVFGGGCETIMHCDSAIVGAESYIGLVEAGVGLIPGGGGTKEFAMRTSDSFSEGDVQIPTLIENFKTIAMASVATSGLQAMKMGYLSPIKDKIILNGDKGIYEAKQKILELSPKYVQPVKRNDILVLGRSGLGSLYVAAESLRLGKYATDHDIVIAKKMAYVLCGGDLSSPQKVSEQYLLDIEREQFLSLCGEMKTLERIQHMLTTNKPLRN